MLRFAQEGKELASTSQTLVQMGGPGSVTVRVRDRESIFAFPGRTYPSSSDPPPNTSPQTHYGPDFDLIFSREFCGREALSSKRGKKSTQGILVVIVCFQAYQVLHAWRS